MDQQRQEAELLEEAAMKVRQHRSGRDSGLSVAALFTWNMFFTLGHPQLCFYLGKSYSSFRPQQTSLPAIRLS